MSPDISEFSYGFALVDELIHWHGWPLTAVPIYPSLVEEGTVGYDVMLQRGGVPVFLQFKLSHYMVRSTAKEVVEGKLKPPFYRMYLRPLKHSDQHRILLQLEEDGNDVFYAAPLFHLPSELNDAYLNRAVRNRSRFFRPSIIGKLPDDERHHVAFKGASGFVFCSKPVSRHGELDGGGFDATMLHAMRDRGKTALTRQALLRLLDQIKALLPELTDKRTFPILADRLELLGQIAYLARTFIGCDMVVIQNREKHN